MLVKKLTLYTSHLARQRAFYHETLGLHILRDTRDSFTLITGLSLLRFQESSSPPLPYHYAFNIPHNQVEEALSWIQPQAPVLSHEGTEIIDFKDWNAHAVYFTDPDGNIVEFIARHNLDNASDKPFGPDSFINISEVGIPSPDPQEVYEHLVHVHGLSLWRGEAGRFGAIGDEHGLFISVPTHRPWYPTDIEAPSASWELRFLHDGKERHLNCQEGILQ